MNNFPQVLNEIKRVVMCDPAKCFFLYTLVKSVQDREGEMAEIGVYKGGTGKLIAKANPRKTVHLFDTFTGLPEMTFNLDKLNTGTFSETSLAQVSDFLKDCPNVVIRPGTFPNTGKGLEDKKFCFVHIDTDNYQSIAECLKFFYPLMVVGGVMVIDDYEWFDCPGVKKAIDEFFVGKSDFKFLVSRYQYAVIKS
jgi:hypothetical protein